MFVLLVHFYHIKCRGKTSAPMIISSYADDLQIYLAVDRDKSIVAALAKVELCIAEVAAWLTNNKLKLNMEKSEVIIFSSAKKRDSLPTDV